MYVVSQAESPLERATRLIPELDRQPEYAAELARRQQDPRLGGIDDMTVSGVTSSLVGPLLERSLRNNRLGSAGKALAYIEGLFTEMDAGDRLMAQHTIEFHVFRPKLGGAARGLLGKRSLDHVRSLEWLWEPWLPVVIVLDALFRDVSASVQSRYPSLKSGGLPVVNSAGCAFQYAYSFMYEPASQRYEDLLLEFAAGHSDLAGAHLADDRRSESVTYQIERGTGHHLAPQLGPIPLPEKRTSAYYATVLEVARRAASHTWRYLEEVLPLLAIPYDVGDGDE